MIGVDLAQRRGERARLESLLEAAAGIGRQPQAQARIAEQALQGRRQCREISGLDEQGAGAFRSRV
jgi:hypothetical protein